MLGLSKGSSVMFVDREMISGSSALEDDLKQQRTLSPGQAKRLNLILIWRSNRIFSRFANLKDFEGEV